MTTPRYPYLHVRVSANDAELVSDQLWVLGASGIEERDDTTLAKAEDGVLLIASFPDEDAAHRALAQLEHPATIEFVVGDEWKDAWREYFHVQQIGSRLVLRPSWREAEAGPGQVVLTIDPGSAFGSGIHETTRLVLKEVEARVAGGESILDVGCGSGILSIAALLLGASSARANDVDPLAISATQENAETNGVSVVVSLDPVESIAGTYDLVLANIQAPILIGMADTLMARSRDTLVLSGVLAGQVDDVVAAFAAFTLESVAEEGEWRAIVLRRS